MANEALQKAAVEGHIPIPAAYVCVCPLVYHVLYHACTSL